MHALELDRRLASLEALVVESITKQRRQQEDAEKTDAQAEDAVPAATGRRRSSADAEDE